MVVRVGDVFCRLTVVGKEGPKNVCLCECGTVKTVASFDLTAGKVRSCGCLSRELLTKRNTTHGGTNTRLYRIWKDMRRRCDNPKRDDYERYGGRGITYHPSFETFEGFLAGIPGGYDNTLTLDRIDANGNYEPGNLRWATQKEQGNNKRLNRVIVDPKTGNKFTPAELGREYGLNRETIIRRVNRGDTFEEIVRPLDRIGARSLSVDKVKEVKHTLWYHTVLETSILTGVSINTVNRIFNGDAYENVSEI